MRRVGSGKLIIFGKFTILSVCNFSKRRLYFYKNTDFPLETASLVFFVLTIMCLPFWNEVCVGTETENFTILLNSHFLYHFAMRRVGSEKLTIFESLPF